MKLYEKVYDIGRIVFWILYAVTLLNLWQKAPHYLEKADDIFKIFVTLRTTFVTSGMSTLI